MILIQSVRFVIQLCYLYRAFATNTYIKIEVTIFDVRQISRINDNYYTKNNLHYLHSFINTLNFRISY